MSISFRCTSCGKKVKAPDKYAGRPVQCPGCGAQVTVPGGASPAGPPAAVAPKKPAPAGEGESPTVVFKRERSWDDGLDMTPMIDVTFLLLIFFTITAAFALQKAIDFPAPEIVEEAASQTSKPKEEEEDDRIEVRIDEESRVWLDDEEISSSHELLRRFIEKMQGSGTDVGGMRQLFVDASGESRTERLVMVVDMGTEAGMDNIEFQTQEEE